MRAQFCGAVGLAITLGAPGSTHAATEIDVHFSDVSLTELLAAEHVSARGMVQRLEAAGAQERFGIDLDVTMEGTVAGLITLGPTAVSLAGVLDWTDDRLAFTPSGCQSVSPIRGTLDGALIETAAAFCLSALEDNAPAVVFGLSPMRLEHLAIGAEGAPFALTSGRSRLEGVIPALALRASSSQQFEAEIAEGRLVISDADLLLGGVSGALVVRPWEQEVVAGQITVRPARFLYHPPPVLPLSLEGRLTVDRDGAIRFGGAAYPGHHQAWRLDLRHDLASGVGRLEGVIPASQFQPQTVQPHDLFPMIGADWLASLTGEAGGEVTVIWGGESLSSSATVTLNDVTIIRPEATLTGVSGRLYASSLAPFRLPQGQTLTIETADVGLGLVNGRLIFGLPSGESVDIEGLTFNWAGGAIRAEPFSVPLDGGATGAILHAQGIDLGRLIEQLEIEDLSATGIVDGAIPFRLQNATVEILNGELNSRGPGVIRYAPEETPEAGEGAEVVDLVWDIIRNFHYERLTMRLNGRTGEDLAVSLEIRGANPEVLEGYPVALNVNVTGELDRILRESLRAINLGDQAREYLESEGSSPGP